MRVTPLALRGAYLARGSSTPDGRGDFSRILDLDALREVVEDGTVSYVASAHNFRRGTVRGLHYQAPPHEEAKTVWCQQGSALDVIVDLRRDEPTFGTWLSVELSRDNRQVLHVPRGVAHGYQTTADDTSMMYMISAPYEPASARTINWQDPELGIDWPLPMTAISDNDASAPNFAAVCR